MAMIVADTDVLIDFERGRDPGAAAVARALEAGHLVTTTMTAFELLSGARTVAQEEHLHTLLAALRLLPLDSGAAFEAARLRRTLDSRGLGLAVADCLIAGLCLHVGAPLLTRNRKHFERVPGLSLVEF